MGDSNIWSEEWDSGGDWSGGGARSKRLPRGSNLGATVYELEPGAWVPFHFHHGSEELMVVLRGQPTLRTGEGERRLGEGEGRAFPDRPGWRSRSLERDQRASPLLDDLDACLPRGSRVPGSEANHGAGADGFADGGATLAHPRLGS
jgi:hypothetical protein